MEKATSLIFVKNSLLIIESYKKGGIFMKILNRIMTVIGYIYATLWVIGVGFLIVHSWIMNDD